MAEVLVIIGVGGMGEAIARRVGAGRRVLLADFNETLLQSAAQRLQGEGYDVTTCPVDVSSATSVTELARTASGLGKVSQIAHTAGLSPAQASTAAILAVDLSGVAYSLDAFAEVVCDGGAAVVIASMAGSMMVGQLPAELEQALAHTPADRLLDLPYLNTEAALDPAAAYRVSKRANQLRVQAASVPWGARGARVNSISPGVIATAMGRQELDGESGAVMRAMVEGSGSKRLGTPADIAEAAAFLLSPASSFITGTDLLVDGGVVAALNSGVIDMPA